MENEIKTKKIFGTATIDHFSPAKEDEWPKAINITLSFEEAMRLHLGPAHHDHEGKAKGL